MLFRLEPWHAHLPRALGAVRIALESSRSEVRRSIPRARTPILRAEEGRADSRHVEDLPQHPECTSLMPMAPRAEIPMPSEKSPQVPKAEKTLNLQLVGF